MNITEVSLKKLLYVNNIKKIGKKYIITNYNRQNLYVLSKYTHFSKT